MSRFLPARARWAAVVIVLFWGLLAWPLSPARAQARSVVWLRLDTDIVVLDNGDLRITETNAIYFIGGPFTFGYRDIDTARLERIFDVRATEDGQPLRIETGRVDGGRFRIKYYFAPAADEARTIALAYTVRGATRYYLNGDQVWWAGVYADRNGFPVEASRLTVQLPAGALAERVETYGPPATITGKGANRVVAEAQAPIPSGQEFEIRVQFPHHIISGEAPAWQQAFDRQRDYEENVKPRTNLFFLTLALLVLFGGPALAALLWFVRGRDPQVGLVAEYLTEPPPDLPPGMAGALIDERADMQDVIATLVDLAQRGVLLVRERGWQNWIIARGPNYGQPLRPFEQALIEGLGLASRAEGVQLQKRRQAFYRYLPRIRSGLYQQLIADGYYNHDPEQARAAYRRFGLGTLGAAAVWVAVSAVLLGGIADTAILLSVSLAVSGTAFLIVSRAMPVRTRKGAEARMRLVAFRRYLAHIERYADVQAAADQFNRYLPYAIAFGLERSWVNKFAAVNAPAPDWFIPRRLPWETQAAPTAAPTMVSGQQSSGQSSGELLSSREAGRLDVSGAARAGPQAPSLADVNQSLTMALSRVNSDLITMFSSAAYIFDSRPPSPTIVALKDTASSVREALADWSSASVSSDSGWSSSSDSGSSSWSGGGSSSGGSSGGGGGGFG